MTERLEMLTEEEFDQAYAKALEDDEFFRTVVYE